MVGVRGLGLGCDFQSLSEPNTWRLLRQRFSVSREDHKKGQKPFEVIKTGRSKAAAKDLNISMRAFKLYTLPACSFPAARPEGCRAHRTRHRHTAREKVIGGEDRGCFNPA